jgi:hypothetical protein
MPRRIQRKRIKGWKMPPGAIYVGRPTKFGNPFKISDGYTPQDAVTMFLWWLLFKDETHQELSRRKEQMLKDIVELRGKDLACWCPEGNSFCHADVLLKLANDEEFACIVG